MESALERKVSFQLREDGVFRFQVSIQAALRKHVVLCSMRVVLIQ